MPETEFENIFLGSLGIDSKEESILPDYVA